MRPVPPAASTEPLTAPEAQALFYDLADNGRIPFNYTVMGCDYRAWQMHAALQKRGYNPQLAWAVESGTVLSYKSPNNKVYNWWFHVAVALPVITETGRAEVCVFDPAIFEGPVRPEVWAEKMQAAPIYFGIHDFDDDSVHDMPHPAVAVRGLMRRLDQETVYERTNEILRRYKNECVAPRQVYPSHVRAVAEQQAGYTFPRQGKSWQVIENCSSPVAKKPLKPELRR